MTDVTPRLSLPLLSAGQSQKEVTHNEALQRLDLLVQSSVTYGPQPTPPSAPQAGQCWIIGRSATGAWAARDDQIAQWTANGWVFSAPWEGMSVWSIAQGRDWRYAAGRWSDALEASAVRVAGRQVVGPQQPAIALPQGGSSPDSEARSALVSIINCLRAHGLIAN